MPPAATETTAGAQVVVVVVVTLRTRRRPLDTLEAERRAIARRLTTRLVLTPLC